MRDYKIAFYVLLFGFISVLIIVCFGALTVAPYIAEKEANATQARAERATMAERFNTLNRKYQEHIGDADFCCELEGQAQKEFCASVIDNWTNYWGIEH